MNKYFAAVCFCFTTMSFAGEINVTLVKGDPMPSFHRGLGDTRTSLEYDIPTGRAWVEVTFNEYANNTDDYSPDYYTARIKVAGLSLNQDTGEIVYTSEGLENPVVCAKLVQKKLLLLKWTALKETGKCAVKMTTAVVNREVDDGFRISKRREHLYRVNMTVTE